MAVTSSMKVKNPNENKKRRVSKKNKTSWRKHCDVKDVDEFLEEQALEERLGGPVSEKPSDELFQIDKGPAVADHLVNIFSSKAAKRASLRKKPLKSFAVLQPHSAVKDPIPKRNRVRTVEERHPVATKIKATRIERGILNKKEKLAIKNRALSREKKKLAAEEKNKPVEVDLWADSRMVPFPDEVDTDWLRKSTVVHTLNNIRSRKCTVPKSIHKKLSVTPVIEAPHPGTSYNPSFADHLTLLQEVADSEKKIMKEEKHLHRVTSRMFSKVTGDQRDKNWMSEMIEGLPQQKIKEEENHSENEGDYKAINPPVKNTKKTLQKRRKIKEARAEVFVRKDAKVEKKKLSDIHRLTVVQRELLVKVEKEDMLRRKREKVKALKEKETRQLSHTKFQPPELEFNMAHELSGNLRTITIAGSLISDRYKSLQKRNIIAPTKGIQLPKKGKVKKFEKQDHKMGWEPKGY